MFDHYKYIYFIGIGGIGMSALARYFQAHGKIISGYDKTPTGLTKKLETGGMDIHYDDCRDAIRPEIIKNRNNTLVVVTPAIPATNSELNYFIKNNYDIKKRAEVVGKLTADKNTVAVAGTHGKTSVSAMISHIAVSAGWNVTAFLGGITVDYGTNMIMKRQKNQKEIFVVEADEYDRSFLTLSPDVAIITAMDADHLDIYGTKENMIAAYNEFAGKVKKNGTLIVQKNTLRDISQEAIKKEGGRKILTYSQSDGSDFFSKNISARDTKNYFSVEYSGFVLEQLELNNPGRHNIENSVAAIAAAVTIGIAPGSIKKALKTFHGVKRRFEFHLREPGPVFIDDYAHHPSELSAFIRAVKEIYPAKRITGVFQPHLYSRTRDFAGEFAEALDMLDDVALLDIYPARELPVEGVSSEMILQKMKLPDKSICNKDELLMKIKNRKPEVLVTIGAGDIDTLIPEIKKTLLQR